MTQPAAVRKVGLVGCGAVAQHFYAPLLLGVPGLSVSGVADLDVAAAERLAARLGCPVRTMPELAGQVDLLLVTTPPGSHHALARQGLEAGADVVVEKPFVVSAAQAEELVALAQSRGRRLWVAQFRRTYPKLQLARAIVASGQLGEVVEIGAFEGGKFGWGTASGNIGRDPHGGVLLDTGAHTLDMALFAAGLDESAFTVRPIAVKRDKPEPAHEVDARFELACDGRVVSGRLFVSRLEALANLVRIRGTQGTIEFGVGCAGGVRVSGPRGSYLAQPDKVIEREADAFNAQYREILSGQTPSLFAASRFVGQMRIMEALLRHGRD